MAKFYKKLVLLSITLILILTLLHQSLNNSKKQNDLNNVVVEQHAYKRQYRVLLWTKWYAFKWTKFLSKHPNCSVTNCLFTDERTDISSYDAIAFHWFNINPRDLPKQVLDRQKWVLYTRESPHYITSSLLSTGLKKIDWMMTYRTGSEVYTPFGSVFKCDTNWKPKYSFEDKTKSIAWFVSHCRTKSKRETYVKKLQQYIDVDIYGWCGPFKCKKNDKTCDEMVSKQYKFYLAFENSICKDYATEKIFRALKYDTIPIVMGGANYSAILPNHSYIDVFNFSSPQLLADYLLRVGSDKNLYNSYFEWKTKYCVEQYLPNKNMCRLCERLNRNEQDEKRPSLEDRAKWWANDAKCRKIKYTNENISLV